MDVAFNNNYKKISDKSLLNLIRRYGPVSKADLGAMTKVTFATVSRAIEDFIKAGIVVSDIVGSSSGGRKPLLYSINGSAYYAVAVHITRKTLEISLVDLKAEILENYLFPMVEGMTPNVVAGKIRETVELINHDRDLEGKLLGIGIAAPGPFDRKNGIILRPHNFPVSGWVNVPIRELVKKETNLPVFIDNKARAAILGEYWYGIAKNFENVVYVDAGNGIGCGHMVHGNLLGGPELDVTGSIGHMVVDINGRECVCGHRGCLETYSSTVFMVAKAREAIINGEPTALADLCGDPDQLTFDHLCWGVEHQDPISLAVIEKAAWVCGVALSNFINLVRPNLIILGGETVSKCPLFYDKAVQTAIETTYPDPARNVKFGKNSLGDQVVTIGAATQVFNHFLDSN